MQIKNIFSFGVFAKFVSDEYMYTKTKKSKVNLFQCMFKMQIYSITRVEGEEMDIESIYTS